MRQMPSLLLISYWYPPAIGAAAERMPAFARGLARHGWDVSVLTAQRPRPAPAAQNVTVLEVDDPLTDSETIFADYDPRVRQGRLAAMLRDMAFPDRFVHWHKAAIRAGRQAMQRRMPDLMVVSFPPASAVLTALSLHDRTGVPLVLDLRDRWLGPGGYNPRSVRARRRHAAMEREAMQCAAAVVTVSEALADAVVVEHQLPRERVWVIPNGYDPEMPEAATQGADSKPQTREPFVIAHVGTVIARNRPELFLEALQSLHARKALAGLMFRFVGNLSRDYVASLGLADVVETTGLVPRAAASRQMREADSLLLLTGDYVGQWGYSAKLFEYLRAGRPILCLEESEGSNDSALLASIAGDRVAIASMRDADALSMALTRLRELAARRGPLPPPAELERFSRSHLADGLAARLERLVEAQP